MIVPLALARTSAHRLRCLTVELYGAELIMAYSSVPSRSDGCALLQQPPAGLTPGAGDDLLDHRVLAFQQVVIVDEVLGMFRSGVVVEHAEFVAAAVGEMQHFNMHPWIDGLTKQVGNAQAEGSDFPRKGDHSRGWVMVRRRLAKRERLLNAIEEKLRRRPRLCCRTGRHELSRCLPAASSSSLSRRSSLLEESIDGPDISSKERARRRMQPLKRSTVQSLL